MVKDNFVRIKHMLDAALAIHKFIQERDRSDLENDLMLSSALIRQLEIMGEAAGGISNDFREEHPSIPWRTIVGMRNRLIHAYFDINLNIVWNAVVVEVPKIIPELKDIISSNGTELIDA